MDELLAELEKKGADIDATAAAVERRPELISELLGSLGAAKARIKYGCEKVLRRVSERAPALLYPFFDEFAALLDSRNSFLKWGAIQIVANLVPVDREGRFDRILECYLSPLEGPEMITAANVVGAAARIAGSRPDLVGPIVRAILEVEGARYENRGIRSPECNRVMCGHALDALDAVVVLIDESELRVRVIEFARRQLNSSRLPVKRRAVRFLRRHAEQGGGPG